MKYVLFCLALSVSSFLSAQSHAVNEKAYKVVFQLTNGDTLVHKAMVRQIGHILEEAPNTKIEVVCHSAGLPFLVTAQTNQAAKIQDLRAKGVTFMACENTMRDRKVAPTDLVPECGTVPSGMVEIIDKQQNGWAYIKVGF